MSVLATSSCLFVGFWDKTIPYIGDKYNNKIIISSIFCNYFYNQFSLNHFLILSIRIYIIGLQCFKISDKYSFSDWKNEDGFVGRFVEWPAGLSVENGVLSVDDGESKQDFISEYFEPNRTDSLKYILQPDLSVKYFCYFCPASPLGSPLKRLRWRAPFLDSVRILVNKNRL